MDAAGDAAERGRVSALHRLHVLDTPPEERFDRVVRLAQRLFDVPMVAVNLVDTDRQFTKAAVGLHLGDTPREESFCSRTVTSPDQLVVPDARLDDRFADHPRVVGEGDVRFYAGQPLAAPGGELVGSLCLVGDQPREFGDTERELLRTLAGWVERELAVDADELQAREVQRRLLPYRTVDLEGWTMAACCVPARLVGGDYYDWELLDDRLQLVVADVMGKGLTAAVLTAGIRSMMRVCSAFNPLAEAVRRTARGMADDFTATGTFATLFACRIDPTTGDIEYVDAGHGLALVVPPDGPARRLASHDLPLGTLDDDSWTPGKDRIAPGEMLFLVSDGVLEIHPEEESAVGAAAALVRDLREPASIVAAIEEYLSRHEIDDDLTAVVVRRDLP